MTEIDGRLGAAMAAFQGADKGGGPSLTSGEEAPLKIEGAVFFSGPRNGPRLPEHHQKAVTSYKDNIVQTCCHTHTNAAVTCCTTLGAIFQAFVKGSPGEQARAWESPGSHHYFRMSVELNLHY
jgi:hypothetical protein